MLIVAMNRQQEPSGNICTVWNEGTVAFSPSAPFPTSLLFFVVPGVDWGAEKIVGGGGEDSLESSVNDEVSGEQLESIFLDQGSPPKRSCQ